MTAAIQRDAERVTAEEIRVMAQDLEEALGNYYSIMCKEFQKAYVNSTINKYLFALSKMYRLGIENKLLKENPVHFVVKFKENAVKRRRAREKF